MTSFRRGSCALSKDATTAMATGVEEGLAGYDWTETLRQRDNMVVQLLAAKKASAQLP
ncbi:MAG: hypothetical protein ABI568_07985 [Pseudarthrobacter sp.]